VVGTRCVLVISQRLAIPRDRDPRLIPKSAQTRERWTEACDQTLDDERSALDRKRDPRVSDTVASTATTNEPGGIAKSHQLPPRPERKVVAVALSTALEFFRGHPVVTSAELRFVGQVPTALKKPPDIVEIRAKNGERLCDMPPHGSVWPKPVPAPARAHDWSSSPIIRFREHLRDHRLGYRRSALHLIGPW
jgi:hypothetical protein